MIVRVRKNQSFRYKLKALGACGEAMNWVGKKSLVCAWTKCTTPTWMMWLLFRLDIPYYQKKALRTLVKEAIASHPASKTKEQVEKMLKNWSNQGITRTGIPHGQSSFFMEKLFEELDCLMLYSPGAFYRGAAVQDVIMVILDLDSNPRMAERIRELVPVKALERALDKL